MMRQFAPQDLPPKGHFHYHQGRRVCPVCPHPALCLWRLLPQTRPARPDVAGRSVHGRSLPGLIRCPARPSGAVAAGGGTDLFDGTQHPGRRHRPVAPRPLTMPCGSPYNGIIDNRAGVPGTAGAGWRRSPVFGGLPRPKKEEVTGCKNCCVAFTISPSPKRWCRLFSPCCW